MTTSLCTVCLQSVPATMVERDGGMHLVKTCPEHGEMSALIAESAAWYRETIQMKAITRPPVSSREPTQGCPFDCGTCSQHEQTLELTIVPITSGCNLDCPICYTHNRNDGAYHMSESELHGIVDVLSARDPNKRIINLTGGEPTAHPHWLELVELCRSRDVRRITISTHGLGLDSATMTRLAALDARVVLSFDSFDDATNAAMLGGAFTRGKLGVLEQLGVHGVATTLLPVIAKGYNDHELGRFVATALDNDHVRSLELHTMTFTGQSGRTFDARGRIAPDTVLRQIEEQTSGRIRVTDFVPAPAAHPLCYQVAYLLRTTDGSWLPSTRFMERQQVRQLLAGSLYLEPTAEVEAMLHGIMTDAWAQDADPLLLDSLRAFVEGTFSSEHRMTAAEAYVKAIYVHSHMDEATFDTDRIRQCCVGISAADGSNVPSCAYNVLYRNRDERFTPHPAAPLTSLGQGRFP